MRTIGKTLMFSLTLITAHATLGRAEPPAAAHATRAKVDWKKIGQHLREHQQYPATKAELVAACNNLVDFSEGEKKWFADTLPERTYRSAGEVLEALKGK